MDRAIVDAVTEWETVSFGGGYEGLGDLADREFSGAVNVGSAWGFMLNGRLVGIIDGTLSSLEATDGTAYEAPDPSLPLLYTMQSQDSEKQAEYYTKDTPISEADETLSAGNFTGYIELSKNVHSGDYYIVYYGGRAMSVAFVGNSRRRLTEDEAYDRANDEIGIYNVYASEIDVIDIPGSEPSSDTDSASDSTSTADSDSADDSDSASDEYPSVTTDDDPDPVDPTGSDDASSTSADASATPSRRPTDSQSSGTAANGGTAADTAGSEPAADTAEADTSTPPTDGVNIQNATGGTTAPDESHTTNGTPATDTGSPSTADTGAASTADATHPADDGDTNPFNDEAEWRNTTTIPSLDPTDEPDTSERTGGQQAQQRRRQPSGDQPSRQQLTERLQQAEAVMEQAENRHQELLEQRDAAREERNAVREERNAAREEIDTLETKLAEAEAKIDELEAKLEAAESGSEPTPASAADAATETTHTLDPAAALEGTNLFVRYDTKGADTLESAHNGTADQDAVNENLRIEHHTTFETDGLSVNDEPFEQFLENRIEYAFADWIVRDLLFEIQATGTQSGMRDIYDAIPTIDRIQLRGTVELGTDEDDEPIERAFDLIVRDKHGNPLFVATFDESNQPVSPEPVEKLIEAGSEIRGREKHFVAGFAVTTSYFDPDALEAADDATGSGLLSRSRGKSFVTLSRKRGFHLCLVDRIDDGFDLRVPEL